MFDEPVEGHRDSLMAFDPGTTDFLYIAILSLSKVGAAV